MKITISWFKRFACLGLWISLFTGCGSGDAATNHPDVRNPDESAAKLDGRKLLGEMHAAYRAAASYRDRGRLTYIVRIDGKEDQRVFPYSVQFVRPGKLRLEAYSATVAADGRKLRAKIADPPSNDFEGQIIVRDAPSSLALGDLYVRDVLADELTLNIGGPLLSLHLLLDDKAIEPLLQAPDAITVLPSREIEGTACRGVQLENPLGRLVFWLDEKSSVLRRLELPTAQMARDVATQSGLDAAKLEVTLVADFAGAELNAKLDEAAFTLAAPAGAKEVDYFVPPPHALKAPVNLLGQALPEFSATLLDGRKLDRAALAGKITVLLFWDDGEAPDSFATVRQLDDLVRQHAANEAFKATTFAAIHTAGDDVSAERFKQRAADLGLQLPIGRAPDVRRANVLGIHALPTLIIVGKDGKVQDLEQGFNPKLDQELPGKLQDLQAGKDVYPEIQKQYQAIREEYEKQLTAARKATRSRK